ncbi:hypothetical protein CMQ_6404 [Grosmannia clavigera kw1407]|uniref:NmrA-like domain-containing protein n=1 Tax=Grosmannia clavigera (strain kw1407 / UAMH 11150) TaxID=655863 RepID=F0XM57_GROCL|nr:uncharacterized protein CMQ_6404 [Grosmannia clavigera kw1407]EFX01462.1 hypothetical protein CMQ_6404 [Grosmannia clavigera kw1407]
MSPIKTVTVAGATGNVGPAVVEQLIKAGFSVTILSRPEAKHTFPTAAKVQLVDYDSLDSLAAALQGQDAVVSTLGAAGSFKQMTLVDAAIKAGVQRFIPSEFGCNTGNPKVAGLPILGSKVEFRTALQKKIAETGGKLSYTGIINGPFFDWGMRIGWLASLKPEGGSIGLWDGGDRVFSTTTLATVGRAVVGVLQHPEETKDRLVYVQDTALTLKQLSEKAQKALGAKGWQENSISVDAALAEGHELLQKPDANMGAVAMCFINTAIFGEGYGAHYKQNDNELLGIKDLTDDEITALIKSLSS